MANWTGFNCPSGHGVGSWYWMVSVDVKGAATVEAFVPSPEVMVDSNVALELFAIVPNDSHYCRAPKLNAIAETTPTDFLV